MFSESTILLGKFTLLACSIISFCSAALIALIFYDKYFDDLED